VSTLRAGSTGCTKGHVGPHLGRGGLGAVCGRFDRVVDPDLSISSGGGNDD
jgi:hypothetical protein